MFILNINDFDEKNLFKCDKHLANILMQHNIPLLGIYKDKYYFTNSEKIQSIVSKGSES